MPLEWRAAFDSSGRRGTMNLAVTAAALVGGRRAPHAAMAPLLLALSTLGTLQAQLFVGGTSDVPAGVTYLPVAEGLAAIDLRDGAVRWRSREAQAAIAAGGGDVLAQCGSGLVVLNQHGQAVVRSSPTSFPAPRVSFALRGAHGSSVTLVWMATSLRGAPQAPRPVDWGTAVFDLSSGALQVTEGAAAERGDPPPPFTAEPAPPLPGRIDGRTALAAPARMGDGTVVVLRREGDAILLYRWREGSRAPGSPRVVARERRGHRIELATVGEEGLLLRDCEEPGGTRCRYEIHSADGALCGSSASPGLHLVGGAALISEPDPDDPGRFRLERVDGGGKVLWVRALNAVPPPAPPPP